MSRLQLGIWNFSRRFNSHHPDFLFFNKMKKRGRWESNPREKLKSIRENVFTQQNLIINIFENSYPRTTKLKAHKISHRKTVRKSFLISPTPPREKTRKQWPPDRDEKTGGIGNDVHQRPEKRRALGWRGGNIFGFFFFWIKGKFTEFDENNLSWRPISISIPANKETAEKEKPENVSAPPPKGTPFLGPLVNVVSYSTGFLISIPVVIVCAFFAGGRWRD